MCDSCLKGISWTDVLRSCYKRLENTSKLVASGCVIPSLRSLPPASSYVDDTRTVNILYVVLSFLCSAAHHSQEEGWQDKVNTILKFARQCTSILATQVDAPALALRLFLLAAQIASECGSGFEDLAYDFYVQAFSVYEDSISESRAQLAAITLIIGTLQGARVFNIDGYDTLITKAALHGARLLKKQHQATAVHAASHLWWQEPVIEEGEADGPAVKESEKAAFPPREDGEGVKAVRNFHSLLRCEG